MGNATLRRLLGLFKAKNTGCSGSARRIRGIVHPVHNLDLRKVERADPRETGHVYAVFIRVRAALMMGIDPAYPTKIMLRRSGIELVKCQIARTLNDLDPVQRGRNRDGSAHFAIRT
jgi:hypothetical protein